MVSSVTSFQTVDSNNVKDLNLARLRSQMSIVSQEPILFACSIKDNISYSVQEEMSMEEIIRVAKMANIHDFVKSLPEVSTCPIPHFCCIAIKCPL